MLDEEHKQYTSRVPLDNNSYVLGRIHGHNVVIACLPTGVYGTTSAATVANNMLRTFMGIRFGLMVGIGGGIPNSNKGVDIRLGDVVVSQPDPTHGGVVQYDFRKYLGDGAFKRKSVLRLPPTLLLAALTNIRSRHQMYGNQISETLSTIIQRFPRLVTVGYVHPGPKKDILYCSNVEGNQEGNHCSQCQNGIIDRKPREDQSPEVHYGIIASGNELIQNAVERDRLGREFGAKCVEVEAAGLMNDFPCIIARGICDYADSHKNDVWHEYATITAACFAKELLSIIQPEEVTVVEQATKAMSKSSMAGNSTVTESKFASMSIEQLVHSYGNTLRDGRKLFALPGDPLTDFLAKLERPRNLFLASLPTYWPISLLFREVKDDWVSKITSNRELVMIQHLQSRYFSRVQPPKHLKLGRFQLILIYFGPLVFSFGPVMISYASLSLSGKSTLGVFVGGTVISAMPLFSVLLKKGRTFNLGSDVEAKREKAIVEDNLRAADMIFAGTTWNWPSYLIADILNVVMGSFTAFSANPVWGISNATPELVGFVVGLPLCIIRGYSIAAEKFPHSAGADKDFGRFVSPDRKVMEIKRKAVMEDVIKQSSFQMRAILIFAALSVGIHIAFIIYNPMGRKAETYTDKAALPALINFITATYLTARLMQQMVQNYLLSHICAEWGAHDWREEAKEVEQAIIESMKALSTAVEACEGNATIPHMMRYLTYLLETIEKWLQALKELHTTQPVPTTVYLKRAKARHESVIRQQCQLQKFLRQNRNLILPLVPDQPTHVMGAAYRNNDIITAKEYYLASLRPIVVRYRSHQHLQKSIRRAVDELEPLQDDLLEFSRHTHDENPAINAETESSLNRLKVSYLDAQFKTPNAPELVERSPFSGPARHRPEAHPNEEPTR